MTYSKPNFLIVLVLILVFPSMVYAQDGKIAQKEFDSIAAPHPVFWEDSYEYWHSPEKYGPDPDLVLEMLQSNPDIEGWHIYYARIAHLKVFEKPKNRDSILYYANKAIEKYKEKNLDPTRNDVAYAMLMYNQIGIQERHVNRDYNKSLNTLIQTLKFAQEHKIASWEGSLNYAIGKNHYSLGNDSIALRYFQVTAQDSVHMSHTRPYVSTNAVAGALAYRMGKLDKAKIHLRGALKASEEGDYKHNIYPILGLLGEVYEKDKNEDSTQYFFKRSMEYYEENYKDNPRAPETSHVSYAIYNAYFNIVEGRRVEEAIETLKGIIDEKMEVENIDIVDRNVVIKCCQYLAKAYEKQGNPSEYTQLIESTISYLNSFSEERLEQDLENLEVEYQTREKELSIAQLEKSKEQQDEIIFQQRIITGSIIGLFLLFAAIAVLVGRQRRLKNQFEKRNLEQRLLRTQLNPHFIFNTLSVIQNSVDRDPKAAKQHMIKFSRLLASVFENLALNYVSLQKEMDAISQYMDLQRIRFAQNFNYKIHLNELDADTVFVPSMLLQPVVENSIVHGFSGIDYLGEITIDLKREDDFIVCKVEDNGKGLTDKNNPSNRPSSTQLITDFMQKIKGATYHVENKYSPSGDLLGVITMFSLPYKTSLDD